MFLNETEEFNFYNSKFRSDFSEMKKTLKKAKGQVRVETEKKLADAKVILDQIRSASDFKTKINLLSKHLNVNVTVDELNQLITDVEANIALLKGKPSFAKVTNAYRQKKEEINKLVDDKMKIAALLQFSRKINETILAEAAEEVKDKMIKQAETEIAQAEADGKVK